MIFRLFEKKSWYTFKAKLLPPLNVSQTERDQNRQCSNVTTTLALSFRFHIREACDLLHHIFITTQRKIYKNEHHLFVHVSIHLYLLRLGCDLSILQEGGDSHDASIDRNMTVLPGHPRESRALLDHTLRNEVTGQRVDVAGKSWSNKCQADVVSDIPLDQCAEALGAWGYVCSSNQILNKEHELQYSRLKKHTHTRSRPLDE